MTLLLPLKLLSESNQRAHWAVRHRRSKAQRQEVFICLRLSSLPRPALPCRITITRIAPYALDSHDNLPASAKAVTDAVSDWLAGEYGQGQDRCEGLEWRYAQRKGKPREYAVEITLEEIAHDHP